MADYLGNIERVKRFEKLGLIVAEHAAVFDTALALCLLLRLLSAAIAGRKNKDSKKNDEPKGTVHENVFGD